jgi:lipopolysaccharide transport system permease protein
MSTTDTLPAVHISARRGITDLGVGEMRGQGHLLWLLTERELKLRYVQTILGPLWVVVSPLVPALLFTFIFTQVATIDTHGQPYIVLVTAAMVPWNTVSRVLGRAGGALIAQRNLLTKVYFPRLLVPTSITLAGLADHAVSLVIVGLAMLQSGTPATWRLLVLPLLAVWTLALSLGTSLLVAATSVRRRDVITAIPIAIQVWLYASPVAYPLSAVSGRVQKLLAFNPMTSLVEAHRWAVLGNSEMGPRTMTLGVIETIVILVVGLALFRAAERNMADVL